MPTDDERREVARELREVPPWKIPDNGLMLDVLEECIFGNRSNRVFDSMCLRLADLIDPDAIPDKPDETGRPLSEPEIDRERLLAIATMMAADSVRSVKKGISVSPVYILHAARNIAEACGETFGSIRNRDLTEWGTSIVPKEMIVDRDALLSLANEMDSEGLNGWASGPVNVGLFARRIREAVGA